MADILWRCAALGSRLRKRFTLEGHILDGKSGTYAVPEEIETKFLALPFVRHAILAGEIVKVDLTPPEKPKATKKAAPKVVAKAKPVIAPDPPAELEAERKENEGMAKLKGFNKKVFGVDEGDE